MVFYSDGGKYAYFEGKRYTRDDKTGYYLNSTLRERLHRAVYSSVNGAIPAGYDIHHIDGNKANNEPENLELLERHAHKVKHNEMMTEEQRQNRRVNMREKAIPAAAKWHKSSAGHQWHLQHYAGMGHLLHRTEPRACEYCGKQFDGRPYSRFCSNACKSAWRRASGIDDIAFTCVICGETFYANKFSKQLTCSRVCAGRLRKNRARNAKAAAAGL